MSRSANGRCLALLLAAAPALAAAEFDVDTDWIDFERLHADEIVHRTGKLDRLTATVDVALLVDAPAEHIWAVLTACEGASEYVPHVESCRRVDSVDGGRSELFVQEVKPAFFLPVFEHVFRLDYWPHERIEVSRVSGPLNHLQGSWSLLEQADGRILLVHSLAVDPGLPIPRFFVRNSLRRDLPTALAEVRRRAEAMR